LTALLKAAIDGAEPLREPDSTTVTEPAVVTVAEQDRPFAVVMVRVADEAPLPVTVCWKVSRKRVAAPQYSLAVTPFSVMVTAEDPTLIGRVVVTVVGIVVVTVVGTGQVMDRT
jgi:hypothetical protein